MRTGVLLLNLGTPEDPSVVKVKDYLEEFLMDPEVIDIPFLLRWLLVKQIILRTRPEKSAKAYSQIWDERGSPLRYHTHDLCEKLKSSLGEPFVVEFGMRYGNPDTFSALQKLKESKVEKLVVFPLYPQFASASVTSSINKVKECLEKMDWHPSTTIIDPFYNREEFIDAWSLLVRPVLDEFQHDHVLMSFHGLPERHVKSTDETKKHCLANSTCCDQVVAANRNCYRAQCYSTARTLAKKLGLDQSDYTVCFQSRLGITPWIRPYTDLVYGELAKKGIKRLLVICPAFVADCLETLEEIGIRGKAQFKSLGGDDLKLVSSLNSSDGWVRACQKIIEKVT